MAAAQTPKKRLRRALLWGVVSITVAAFFNGLAGGLSLVGCKDNYFVNNGVSVCVFCLLAAAVVPITLLAIQINKATLIGMIILVTGCLLLGSLPGFAAGIYGAYCEMHGMHGEEMCLTENATTKPVENGKQCEGKVFTRGKNGWRCQSFYFGWEEETYCEIDKPVYDFNNTERLKNYTLNRAKYVTVNLVECLASLVALVTLCYWTYILISSKSLIGHSSGGRLEGGQEDYKEEEEVKSIQDSLSDYGSLNGDEVPCSVFLRPINTERGRIPKAGYGSVTSTPDMVFWEMETTSSQIDTWDTLSFNAMRDGDHTVTSSAHHAEIRAVPQYHYPSSYSAKPYTNLNRTASLEYLPLDGTVEKTDETLTEETWTEREGNTTAVEKSWISPVSVREQTRRTDSENGERLSASRQGGGADAAEPDTKQAVIPPDLNSSYGNSYDATLAEELVVRPTIVHDNQNNENDSAARDDSVSENTLVQVRSVQHIIRTSAEETMSPWSSDDWLAAPALRRSSLHETQTSDSEEDIPSIGSTSFDLWLPDYPYTEVKSTSTPCPPTALALSHYATPAVSSIRGAGIFEDSETSDDSLTNTALDCYSHSSSPETDLYRSCLQSENHFVSRASSMYDEQTAVEANEVAREDMAGTSKEWQKARWDPGTCGETRDISGN